MSLVPLAAEIDNVMNVNRRMKEEREKHAGENKEQGEKHAVEMDAERDKHVVEMEEQREKHAIEMKEQREKYAVEMEEQRDKHVVEMEVQREKLDTLQNEFEHLRQRIEVCEQQVSSGSATRRSGWNRKTLRGACVFVMISMFSARLSPDSPRCYLLPPRCSIMG